MMEDLTFQLEDMFAGDCAYVLWGTYEDKPEYLEHHFSILGSICGFIPSVSMRGEILGKPSLDSEWRRKGEMLVHRSGLTDREASQDVLDPSAFHPMTITSEIDSLFRRVLRKKTERVDLVEVIPFLNWTSDRCTNYSELTSQPSLESPLVHLAQPTR